MPQVYLVHAIGPRQFYGGEISHHAPCRHRSGVKPVSEVGWRITVGSTNRDGVTRHRHAPGVLFVCMQSDGSRGDSSCVQRPSTRPRGERGERRPHQIDYCGGPPFTLKMPTIHWPSGRDHGSYSEKVKHGHLYRYIVVLLYPFTKDPLIHAHQNA